VSGEPAEVIEGGGRRRRGGGAVVIAAVTALAGLSVAYALGRDGPPGGSPPSGPAATATARTRATATPTATGGTAGGAWPRAESGAGEVSNSFVPPTRSAADAEVVMPVTFPDGSTAEVRYPRRLGLAGLGVRPSLWARYRDGARRPLFAPPRGELWFTGGGGIPLRTIPGPDGADGTPVTVWRSNRAADFNTEFLVFGFGRWRLAVADDGNPEMLFDERAGWAANLRGREVRGGFLELQAGGGLRLAEPGTYARGDPAGPHLRFGDPGGREVWLIPLPGCGAGDEVVPTIGGPRPDDTGAVCRGSVLVAVAGDGAFVADVLRTVRVDDADIRG
jgi:hypothetical protein